MQPFMFALFFSLWIWISYRLYKVYNIGAEVYFNVVYKANQSRSSSSLRKQYNLYLISLWSFEFLFGFASMITLAIWIKS